jgi:hypothetical protein
MQGLLSGYCPRRNCWQLQPCDFHCKCAQFKEYKDDSFGFLKVFSHVSLLCTLCKTKIKKNRDIWFNQDCFCSYHTNCIITHALVKSCIEQKKVDEKYLHAILLQTKKLIIQQTNYEMLLIFEIEDSTFEYYIHDASAGLYTGLHLLPERDPTKHEKDLLDRIERIYQQLNLD